MDFFFWYITVGVVIAMIDLVLAKDLEPPIYLPFVVILMWPVFVLHRAIERWVGL